MGCRSLWTHFDSHTGGKGSDDEHDWKVKFDVVDLLFAYNYEWTPCFVLTPFAGVRYATINQKLNTHFISSDVGVLTTSTGHSKENFLGVGPLGWVLKEIGTLGAVLAFMAMLL